MVECHKHTFLNFAFFHGYEYNQFVIGSNGAVSFNASNAGAFNNWNISGAAPFNNPADLTNCIMAPWQSLDSTTQGSVYYQLGGIAPCRYVVVSWYRRPLYSDPSGPCDSVGHQTQMVVFYETSNIIDIYIQEKSFCPEWNNGWAIEGIQNAAGDVAYTVLRSEKCHPMERYQQRLPFFTNRRPQLYRFMDRSE